MVRERERERERGGDSQTDRQTETETERQRQRQTDRQTDRQTENSYCHDPPFLTARVCSNIYKSLAVSLCSTAATPTKKY